MPNWIITWPGVIPGFCAQTPYVNHPMNAACATYHSTFMSSFLPDRLS